MDLYVSIAAPAVDRRIDTLAQRDKPSEIRQESQRTDASRAIWKSWALRVGGSVLVESGASVKLVVPADAIEDLEALRIQYAHSLGCPVAVGIGTDTAHADRALEASIKMGGGTLPYSEYVEELLEPEEQSDILPLGKAEDGGVVYRGISQAEHDYIRDHGHIASDQRWCVPGEGTCFGDYGTAEDYANFGRTNPEKTGLPTYVLEVGSGPDIVVDPHDGYPKAQAHIPASRIRKAWRFRSREKPEEGRWGENGWEPIQSIAKAEEPEADYESALHAHAAAQQEQDEKSDRVKDARYDHAKQQVVQALKLLRDQAPVMAQLEQSAPDVYRAMLGLSEAVVGLSRVLRGASEPQNQEESQPEQSESRNSPHPNAYPWHDGHTDHYQDGLHKADTAHPHTWNASVSAPPKESLPNDQAAGKGVSTYAQYALPYGTIDEAARAGAGTNLNHYPYEGKAEAVAGLLQKYGYTPYYAGGQYGKPDLANRNYNTRHLMIYDPTPQSGGDFGNREYTDNWRKVHELAHALTYPELNRIYGEGRRIGKLGYHRTAHEAQRAVHWEHLAAHKQRELNREIGIEVPDDVFHKELNTVLHDAVHRAVTGKFTEPSQEGFVPSSTPVPLAQSLGMVRDAASKMGLGEYDLLKKPATPAIEKSEELEKMAIADIPLGRNLMGKQYDYNHVLTPEHRAAGYSLQVRHEPDLTEHVGQITSMLSHNGANIGSVRGYLNRATGSIEPHSDIEAEHRGKGLGNAMYEALMAHAFHNGIRTVAGGPHSELASGVHRSLARKHGLTYSPSYEYGQDNHGDNGPYTYTLKSERPQEPTQADDKLTRKSETLYCTACKDPLDENGHCKVKAHWPELDKSKLSKGAMRRLAPFNPETAKDQPAGTLWNRMWNRVEPATVRDQMGAASGGDASAREDLVATGMSPAARQRSLHKLTGHTQFRRSSNGDTEFLLHRGISRDEAPLAQEGRYRNEHPSSWTPLKQTADRFAHEVPTLSAWIPSSAIRFDVKQHGGWKRGPHPYQEEYELLVAPGEYELHQGEPVSKEELEKAKLPLPENSEHSTRHKLQLPVGAQHNQKFRVRHSDGSISWVSAQSGVVLSNDGHPISSRNAEGR